MESYKIVMLLGVPLIRRSSSMVWRSEEEKGESEISK